jgi:uncharacterized protein (DUF169 family)
MSTWSDLERRISERIALARRPVAVAYLDAPPAGIEKFSGTEPSGCSFWRLAAFGHAFYTVPADHFNCAVGSYTHNIPLSPEREKETEQTLGMMFGLGYIKPEEVPGIPRLPKTPNVIAYAPLGETPVAPDVVLFACKPSAAMLLNEATIRAGIGGASPALGRPTCMALPASIASSASQMSLGCIGNRVYTGLGDDELYIVVPGKSLEKVAAALETIATANAAVADYARGRKSDLATI